MDEIAALSLQRAKRMKRASAETSTNTCREFVPRDYRLLARLQPIQKWSDRSELLMLRVANALINEIRAGTIVPAPVLFRFFRHCDRGGLTETGNQSSVGEELLGLGRHRLLRMRGDAPPAGEPHLKRLRLHW
jgi:hypothetical protein